jgi:hypothetical protein
MTVLELPSAPPPTIAPALREPLEIVAARSRLMRWSAGVLALAIGILASGLLLVVLLASATSLTAGNRIALVVGALGLLLAALVLTIRWSIRPATLPMAARAIERAAPDLQERLTSAYELATEEDADFRGSPDMLARLNSEAILQANAIDPGAVVPGRTVLVLLAVLAPLVVAWIMAVVLAPRVMGDGLHHLFFPWQQVIAPAPTISVTPGDAALASGDPLEIRAQLLDAHGNPRSDVHTATVTLTPATGAASVLDMVPDPASPGAFSARVDQVNQAIQYNVSGGGCVSADYQVSVATRPTVRGVTLTYHYPAYTKLADKSLESNDGAITAVVGTRVTIGVHTDATLASQSAIIVAPDTPEERSYALSMDAAHGWSVDVPITRSAAYVIRLQNPPSASGQPGLTNAHEPARTITALPDLPPTIAITSPLETVRIRPTDSLDLTYHATDDFALGNIEAMLQFDDGDSQTRGVMAGIGKRFADGTYTLDLRVLLAGRQNSLPQQVRVRLRASDTMTPEPQVTTSAPLILLLDPDAPTMAARAEAAAAERLRAAADAARAKIDAAQKQLAALQAAAPHGLTDDQQQQATEIANQVRTARDALRSAATANHAPAFQPLAEQLKTVADRPLNAASDQLDRAASTSDASQQKSLAQSQAALQQARDQLAALNHQLDQQAAARGIARELADAAARQQHVADNLATATGAEREKLLAEQKETQARLAKLLADHPDLQKPVRDQTTRDANATLQQLDQTQQQQKAVAAQINREAADRAALEGVDDLARQQKELNDRVAALEKSNGAALARDGTPLPKPADAEQAARDLANRSLDSAATQQRALARSMAQAAEQLHAAEGGSGDQGAAERAKALDQQAQALGNEIQKAQDRHDPPTLPSDPANQHAKALADAVTQEAHDVAARNPAAKAAADQAAAAAAKAKAAAAAGQAGAAQQSLQQATAALKAAAPQSSADPHGQSAAQQAADLAKQQQQLADQTAAAAAAQQRSQTQTQSPSTADQSKQQSDQVARQLEQAANAAGRMKERTQQTSPQMSQQAAQAEQALHEAAREQQAAGQASDPKQASDHQAAAQDKASAAQKILSKLSLQSKPSSAGDESAKQSSGQEGASQSASGQSGQPASSGQKTGGQATGESASGQGGSPSGSSSPGNSGGQSGQSADGKASGDSTSGAPSGMSDGQSSQLGRGLLEAMSAQQRAAGGDLVAARQASDLLNRQAAQVQQMQAPDGAPAGTENPGSAGGSTSSMGQDASAANASARGDAGGRGGHGGAMPGAGGGASANGAIEGQSSSPIAPSSASAAAQVGIPPSEWAKLTPDLQRSWLNAAQQKAPPEYQQAVRNYFERIAHLSEHDSDGGAAP